MNDTIVAISTTKGVGAISIIRVSGTEALSIVNKIFTKDLTKLKSHTINYGHIQYNNETIDEVMVTIMLSPHSYTKENVVEINCHGGIAPTNKILELLLEQGCRLAEPGEFTKRAFLNGRINLAEAESIMDMINTKTEISRKIAIKGMDGSTAKLIQTFRKKILQLLASIEVNIDYPEYEDMEQITKEKLLCELLQLDQQLQIIYNQSLNQKIVKEGINIAIIGRPNVGKSSLLNLFLREEKAIVTDIAGTTRDIVEGSISMDGLLINLIDTAGIRKTKNEVEKIGVEKSYQAIETADLVIYMLNNNEKIKEADLKILDQLNDNRTIVIINKNDLKTKINKSKINFKNIIESNTKNDDITTKIKEKIIEIFNIEELKNNEYVYLSNTRQINLIKESLKSIREAKKGIMNNMPLDMVEIDIKEAWNKLGEITGEAYSDELLDQLFSQFCLGK